MEAAACYVGECRGGARDAKIALTAEGIFGMFIYIATPLMFVAVLGLSLTTIDPLTMYLSYTEKIFGQGSWEKWFIGIPLILALALSVLNAIMGCGRSLYQAAEDGQLPRIVRAQEPARRAQFRDGLQRGVLGDPGAARLAGADLHHLQRRLPAVLHARHRRLLRLPAAAAGCGAAVPAADLGQVDRAGGVHHLDGHLLLRRLELAEDRGRAWPGTRALPARAADRRALRPALLVAGAAGPQAGRGRRSPRREGLADALPEPRPDGTAASPAAEPAAGPVGGGDGEPPAAR